MSRPISPPAASRSGTRDLPAYVSSGLVGLRVLDLPLLPGVVLVSGYAGIHPQEKVEAAAQAPYPISGDLQINGVRLTNVPHQASFEGQEYDFSNGELTTRFRFEAGGVTARVEVLTVCSRKRPALILQEVAVEVDAACDLGIRSRVETSQAHGRMVTRTVGAQGKEPEAVDGSMEWEALGATSSIGIAFSTELLGEESAHPQRLDWGLETDLATDYTFRARAGRRYRLRQMAAMVPNVLHHDPDHAAMRLVARAKEDGWDRLREENRVEWNELWKGRVLIDADDDRWQQLADAAFFYLNTSVHPSAPCSTSMYGLAMWNDYHYYYGHVMWDVEFFGLPPLLLVQPDAAHALLEFRIRTIEAARGNAKLNGRAGIQFPWESGPRHGEEAAPGAGRASWHEDHVSPDVAWAFSQYAHATSDRRFLADHASRVLYGVADWIVSRVHPVPGGYEWRETMGIAERKRPSDNDAFTIMGARTTLREAIECADRLGHDVPWRWRAVLEGLQVRPSRDRNAIMSHDRYNPREEKGATPGPLAGIFPLWHPLDRDVEQQTLRYYLDLADDYVGSPMLSPLYGTWACWAGDRRLAVKLYEQGYAELVGGRFLQTLEQSPTRYPENPPSGPFFANIGAFLMGLMYGLPGVRISAAPPEQWPSRPVILPAGWRSIEIERAWIHTEEARLVARHGAERAEIVLPGRGRRARRAA